MGTLGRSLSSNKGKKIPHGSGHNQLLPSLTNKQHKVGGEMGGDLLAHTPRSGSRKLRSGSAWRLHIKRALGVDRSARTSCPAEHKTLLGPADPRVCYVGLKKGHRWCNWLGWSSGVSLWDVPPAMDQLFLGRPCWGLVFLRNVKEVNTSCVLQSASEKGLTM